MRKIHVLDTSTIISDPQCLNNYPDSDIIIHTKVLYELDKLKTSPNETGKNARVFIRTLDDMSNDSDIVKGIDYNNSIIKIDSTDYSTKEFGDPNYVDNVILACAKHFSNEKFDVTVISQDINLRLRAKSAGMTAADHFKRQTKTNELYSGIVTISDEKIGTRLKRKKIISTTTPELKKLHINECVIFTSEDNKTIALGRKIDKNKIRFVNGTKAWGLAARNLEQAFALDLLMDPDVPLISLVGIAGTGKSLLAVAAGIESVLSKKEYDKLVIYRPMEPVGANIGYLPGTLNEKLDPWMAAIKDSMERLSTPSGRKSNGRGNNSALLMYNDKIQMEALTYIRGRSMPNTFIIVDEVQNISKNEIKTILTRVGENTKIILTGDIEQIDSQRLDAINNGLTYVIERFKSSRLSGHVTLTKGERSELAEEAANLL